MNTVDNIFIMISGGDITKNSISMISEQDKAQIQNALESIFKGISTQTWIDGGTLSDAWNTALDKLREMMFCFPITNQMVSYLHIATFEHRKKWQNNIPGIEYRLNKCPQMTNSELCEIIKKSTEQINQGIEIIKQKINNFDSSNNTNKTFNHTILQTNTHEQTKEQEYERTK